MKVNVQISDLCVFCDEEKRAAEEKRLRGRCTRHKPEGRADATCTINYLNKKKKLSALLSPLMAYWRPFSYLAVLNYQYYRTKGIAGYHFSQNRFLP